MAPESMDSRPAIARKSVDFPHPEGPRTTRNSLAPTSSETSSSTNEVPNRLVTPLSARPITHFPCSMDFDLVIVAGDALGARDALIFHRRFDDRSGVHLPDDTALHFLPGRLTCRIGVPPGGLQILPALLHFDLGE